MNETTKAYLAGILDADGYFTIKRSTYHQRVRSDATNPVFSERIGIKQVTPDALNLLQECFGGSVRIEKPSAKRGKPLYSWIVSDKIAATVAKTLLPYLRIKKRQAQLLLDLRDTKDNVRRVHDGSYFETTSKAGRKFMMPRMVVDPVIVDRRAELCVAIKALNDTRNTQPRLLGKG